MRNGGVARRRLLSLAGALFVCGSRAQATQRRPSLPVIAIDPGHGGVDPGAISPTGLYEKDITLDTALILARLVNATARFRTVMTRRGNIYVPLRERVLRARAHHADLLISIHADTLPDSALRGLSVYTLSAAASDRESAALAARENRDNFIPGLKLSRRPAEIGDILADLARRRTSNRSLTFAHLIVDRMGQVTPLLERPQRAAGFTVLTAPDIPSVLVELGCLSNPNDEHLLEEDAYRLRLARGLLDAIEAYFAAGTGSV
jgi:N-acetylmuramoyl-L-alanine amidase